MYAWLNNAPNIHDQDQTHAQGRMIQYIIPLSLI